MSGNIISKFFYKTLNYLFYKTNWFYENVTNGTRKFWHYNNFNTNIINLGNEEAISDYTSLSEGYDTYGNWALPRQPLVYDYNILKNYFSYLVPNAIVILPISPLSILKQDCSISENSKYYTILHPATIYNFQDSERIKSYQFKNNPSKTSLRFCISQILYSPIQYILRTSKLLSVWNSSQTIRRIKREYPLLFMSSTEEDIKKYIIHNLNIISQIKYFCIERNLKLIIVIPPYKSQLKKKLKFSNQLINIIKEQNFDTPILNYYNHPSLLNSRYFKAGNILNKKGRNIFMKQLRKDIETIYPGHHN